MFMPKISVENDSFILKVIMPGDAAATLEYLRLNEYGLHLNALRRLPLLWYHALHDVGGMQPQRLVEMMTFVAAFYEDWPLPPYGVPVWLGGAAAWHTQVKNRPWHLVSPGNFDISPEEESPPVYDGKAAPAGKLKPTKLLLKVAEGASESVEPAAPSPEGA